MCPPSHAGGDGAAQVLAQGAQPQGGHVPQRTGGDLGRDGAGGVCEGHGASLQADCQVYFQPTLPGMEEGRGEREGWEEVDQGEMQPWKKNERAFFEICVHFLSHILSLIS